MDYKCRSAAAEKAGSGGARGLPLLTYEDFFRDRLLRATKTGHNPLNFSLAASLNVGTAFQSALKVVWVH